MKNQLPSANIRLEEEEIALLFIWLPPFKHMLCMLSYKLRVRLDDFMALTCQRDRERERPNLNSWSIITITRHDWKMKI